MQGPAFRTMVNWLTFYLGRGETYTTLLPGFEARFGQVPQAMYDAAFDAASLGLANAFNIRVRSVRNKIKNAFTLPTDQYDTVQVRAIVTWITLSGEEINRTFMHDFSYDDTISDIYAFFSDVCSEQAPLYNSECVGYTIIPGIYLPSFGES